MSTQQNDDNGGTPLAEPIGSKRICKKCTHFRYMEVGIGMCIARREDRRESETCDLYEDVSNT